MNKLELFKLFQNHMIKSENTSKWRGIRALKLPSDFMLYQEVIFQNKPDFIIETGTRFGGSAHFFADMCELNKKGHVISIDVRTRYQPPHPRVTYLSGNSVGNKVVRTVSRMVAGKSVMVILDSGHRFTHVCNELRKYSRLVTKGQFMVVEDGVTGEGELGDPARAIEWFMKQTTRFKRVDLGSKFIIGCTMGGWLKRI